MKISVLDGVMHVIVYALKRPGVVTTYRRRNVARTNACFDQFPSKMRKKYTRKLFDWPRWDKF